MTGLGKPFTNTSGGKEGQAAAGVQPTIDRSAASVSLNSVQGFPGSSPRCAERPEGVGAEWNSRPEMLRFSAAVVTDAAHLTELTRASKAAWGYSDDFMRRVDGELVVEAADIESGALRAWMAFDGDELVGYYAFRGTPPVLLLDSMFVAPSRLRTGVGRALWDHALETARELGATSFTLDADPNAAGFYRAAGARETGSTPSRSFPERMLPSFEMSLDARHVEDRLANGNDAAPRGEP